MSDIVESKKPSQSQYGKLVGLAYLVLILFACTWAKEFLLPIVLAILISFLLAPVVSRLERWGFHPVLAVLSVATFSFAILGALCTTMSMESLDIGIALPNNRDYI